jgi:hypothetical protein
MQENLNVRICDLIIGETAMRLTLALCLAASFAVPVHAQTARPDSCERIATTQLDNCSVTNTFRCQGEAFSYWIENLDADAVLTIETRNANHGSMSVFYVGQDLSMEISQSKAHPRDTIQNGSAEDRIAGELEVFGMKRPISGQSQYGHAGETVVLAGETFARIVFTGAIQLPPPMPPLSGGGTLLYSDRLDLLIEEEVRYEAALESESYRLAHLALADQAGFGDETPGYGCGEMSFLVPRDAESAS